MSILYVLLLENNKYYVGRTSDFDKRLIEHSSGNGSEWTSLHKVIKPLEVIKNCKPQDEDSMTISYMAKYGIENVRGGTFCNVVLSQETIKILNNMVNTQKLTCYKCNKEGHYSSNCPEQKSSSSVTCYKCGEKGHYANRCFGKKKIEEKILEVPKEIIETKKDSKISGIVSIKSCHNKWLCFDSPKKASIVSADRDNIGEFEKFTVIYAENDEIKLFCPKHNTYLAAKDNGEVYQTTESDKQNVLWKIEVVSVNVKTGKIEKLAFLHAKNKKYLCAERLNLFNYGKVIADRDNCKSFETWELRYLQ